MASLHGWGRRARRHAARSARWARYPSRPPLRASSRLTVEGARPNRDAITRSDSPAATPLEISSRSVSERWRSARRRGAGRTPPASSNNRRIDDPFLPKRRAIDRVNSPALRRSHTSAISASVNLLDTPHLPDETTQLSPRCCVHALRRQAICATWVDRQRWFVFKSHLGAASLLRDRIAGDQEARCPESGYRPELQLRAETPLVSSPMPAAVLLHPSHRISEVQASTFPSEPWPARLRGRPPDGRQRSELLGARMTVLTTASPRCPSSVRLRLRNAGR